MKSLITLDRPIHGADVVPLLSKNGYACALVSLAAGEEMAIEHSSRGDEHLVFVIDGEVTVRCGEINTMLAKNEAHLLPQERDCTVRASGERPAKLLRVDVPPRRIVDAPLYTLDAKRA